MNEKDSTPDRRRVRKPGIAGVIKAALRAGVQVSAVTIDPDGRVSVTLGEPNAKAAEIEDLKKLI